MGFAGGRRHRRPARALDGLEPPRRGAHQSRLPLIRPIPPLAWIPLAIVWLGLGDAAKIMVIFFAAFVPSVINTYTGVRAIEPPHHRGRAHAGHGRWRF